MGLLEQIRLLDRALREPDLRASLRSGKKVRGQDVATLAAVDARRLEAVSGRLAELIRDRWWRPRFPGTLEGAARHLKTDTLGVAQAALRSPHYQHREGEDEKATTLLGWLLDQDVPRWLVEVAVYEYVLAVALPRRARGAACDPELEARLLPEGTLFLEPEGRAPRKGEVVLAGRTALVPLEHDASGLRDAVASGKKPARGLLAPAPHVLGLFVGGDELVESPLSFEAADALALAATPISERTLDEEVGPALDELFELGALVRARRRK